MTQKDINTIFFSFIITFFLLLILYISYDLGRAKGWECSQDGIPREYCTLTKE